MFRFQYLLGVGRADSEGPGGLRRTTAGRVISNCQTRRSFGRHSRSAFTKKAASHAVTPSTKSSLNHLQRTPAHRRRLQRGSDTPGLAIYVSGAPRRVVSSSTETPSRDRGEMHRFGRGRDTMEPSNRDQISGPDQEPGKDTSTGEPRRIRGLAMAPR